MWSCLGACPYFAWCILSVLHTCILLQCVRSRFYCWVTLDILVLELFSPASLAGINTECSLRSKQAENALYQQPMQRLSMVMNLCSLLCLCVHGDGHDSFLSQHLCSFIAKRHSPLPRLFCTCLNPTRGVQIKHTEPGSEKA